MQTIEAQETQQSLRRARRAKWASGLASGACAIGFVLWARRQQLPSFPGTRQSIAALILAMAAYACATLSTCERWTTLLRRIDRDLPRTEGYWSSVLGQLGNVCLPVRAGDAIRVGLVATAREKVTARSSVGVIVAERSLDAGCHTILLVAVCLGLFGPTIGGAAGRVPTVIAGLALLLVAAGAAFYIGRAILARWPANGRVATFLAPVFAPVADLRRGSRKVILLSVGLWLSEAVGWWAASRAVGLNLSPSQAACVFAIAAFALIAPIGFGAIGTLDAAIVFSVEAVGAPTAHVLGFVLLLRTVFLLPSAFIAIGLWWARRLRSRDIRQATNGAQEVVDT